MTFSLDTLNTNHNNRQNDQITNKYGISKM